MAARSFAPLALALLAAACAAAEAPVAPRARAEPALPAPPADEARHLGALELREPPRPAASECVEGEVRSCGIPRGMGPDPSADLVMRCRAASDGSWHFARSDCATPLVLAFELGPVEITRPPGAFAIGPYPRTEWVSARTPWLVLGRDGTGCAEDARGLFGPPAGAVDATGFESLAALDDRQDGWIDAEDAAFARLALWFDRDQDRRCVLEEVISLAAAGVVAIELRYARGPGALGSYEGASARMMFRDGAGRVREGRVIDVYLAPMDGP